MHQKILRYIELHSPVSYNTLAERAEARGLSLNELDELLAKVHKDKRVKTTTSIEPGKTTIIYMWSPPKVKSSGSHLTWLRENYPRPDNFIEPFPEWDLSFLFLTPEAMLEYKASISGRNKWQLQKAKSKQTSSSTSRKRVSSAGGKTTYQSMTQRLPSIGRIPD